MLDYLIIPRPLLRSMHGDSLALQALTVDGADERAIRIKLMGCILANPDRRKAGALTQSNVIAPPDLRQLRDRLCHAEKLLRECEPMVSQNARYIRAGTLEYRIGEFLSGKQPVLLPEQEPVAPIQPADKPVANTTSKIQTEKLVALSKKPPKPAAKRESPQAKNRRMAVFNAHRENDSGPIKSHSWLLWDAKRSNKPPPIVVGDRFLPGELGPQHLEELESTLPYAWSATHFLVSPDGFLTYYAFQPGKGWCFIEVGTLAYYPDGSIDGGLSAVFSIALAIEYLRGLANSPNEAAKV